MGFLEKLLNGVAVEWKALDDLIVSLKTGLNPRQNFQLNTTDAEGYYVTVREIQNGEVSFLDKTDRVNKKALELINNRSNLEAGDLLFSGTGTVGRSAIVKDTPKNWNIKEGVYAIKPNLEKIHSGYLSHLLNSREIVSDYSKKIVGAPVISLPMSDLRRLKIPIPCPDNPAKSLKIQREIVRILDNFTELTGELTAELSARKKQYNYYRDQLLSFENGDVEWKTLEDISKKISSGGTPPTGVAEYYDGDIPWLRTQEVDFREIWDTGVKITEAGLENSSAKWISENCVIVAMYGATVGKIGINKIPMATNQACANISIDEKVADYRYIFHFLTSQYEYIKSLGTGSQTNINAQIVKNLKVPIPFANEPQKSLIEQARIVAILDKFDALTNSITEGLPREIELRQKQYEYYRDLLLSFPKPEEVAV